MAELALGIAGIALAWKGIIDFGELIIRLTHSDSRQRERLSIRLEVSQYVLKDWGSNWGVDRSDGRFHTFEPARKELIMKIVFKLHDSRLRAIEILKTRYLVSEDDKSEGSSPESRLSRMVDKVKGASKKVKNKGTWLIHDQAEIVDLVDETMELHENLQYLTYGSNNFIASAADSARMEGSIEAYPALMDKQSHRSRQRSNSIADIPASTPGGNQLDEQTLTSYATKSIISSSQAGLIQQHIDGAFHFYGNARVAEIILTWWNDEESGILVLETSDIAGDDTSTFACALVYYFVPCTKLIYSFRSDSEMAGSEQFAEMLRTFISRIVVLRDGQPLCETTVPHSIINKSYGSTNTQTMKQLLSLFQQVFLDFVNNSNCRISIVIDGLETIGVDDSRDLSILVQSFVTGLQSVCKTKKRHTPAVVKVLMGCKGYATTFYECVGEQEVADLTDYPRRKVNMMYELEEGLRV